MFRRGNEGKRNTMCVYSRIIQHTRTLTSEVVVLEVEVDQAVQRSHILQQAAFRPPGQINTASRGRVRHTRQILGVFLPSFEVECL